MGERKRWRRVSVKSHELVARYGYDEDRNLGICYGAGGPGNRPDARVLCNALEGAIVCDGRTLAEELERRGYDLTTIRFSIERKRSELNARPIGYLGECIDSGKVPS